VRGYEASSYGDAFADVYDDWYADVSDVAATVGLVARRCADSGGTAVLELGVGTGRLAVPLADAGLSVTGVDASRAMLDRLAVRDPDGRVTAVLGDMVDDLPGGPFDVVLVAYNTLFNVVDPERQHACFAAVARRLAPGGSFLVEAFVPAADGGSRVSVRSMAVDHVVLSVSVHDADAQRAEGHYVSLSEDHGVRLRPWSIRYATPDQLDAMAAAAGLTVHARWEDVAGRPFGPDSDRHVTCYVRAIDGT
jgi:SAM-dependent methyltransferase